MRHVTSGINYVNATYDAGANIEAMNMSFNTIIGSDSITQFTFAMIRSNARSIATVTSAGNGIGNVGRNLDETDTLLYPQDLNFGSTITVAATDDDDQLTAFSDYGEQTVDVAAPGQAILTSGYSTSSRRRRRGRERNVVLLADRRRDPEPRLRPQAELRRRLRAAGHDRGLPRPVEQRRAPEPVGHRFNAAKVLADIDPGYDAIAYGDFGGMRMDDQFVVRVDPDDPGQVEVRWFNTEPSIAAWEVYLTMENSPGKTLGLFTLAVRRLHRRGGRRRGLRLRRRRPGRRPDRRLGAAPKSIRTATASPRSIRPSITTLTRRVPRRTRTSSWAATETTRSSAAKATIRSAATAATI